MDYQSGDDILILTDNPTTLQDHGIGPFRIYPSSHKWDNYNSMSTTYCGAYQYLPSQTILALTLLIHLKGN